MPNKRYQKGVRHEWAIRNHYRELGFEVIRASGSRGVFDLVAIKPSESLRNGQIVLIQAKSGKSAKRALEKLKPLKNQFEGVYSVSVELL